MSFILDALKKSESDRQRQSGPSLFEVKVTPPRRTLPIWAVAIAVLLGINAIVVSWMLLRRGPAAPPAAAAAPAAAAPTAVPAADKVASTAATATPGVMAPTPVAAQSAPATAAAAPPAAGADESAGQAPAADNPSDYAPAVEPASTQGSGAADGETGDLPLYQQIAASASLPALHLDLHVFAARPQDRFVMINMEKLGEGASLPNGVRVEAIRPDGVVLSYHGTRFLLPRN